MAFQACTKRMRALLQDEAALHGWQLSVDMFASEANAVTPRFFARSRSRAQRRRMPLPCWTGSSRCAACGERHRELIFAYLPPDLVNVFLRKAMADGVRGLVIVPTSIRRHSGGDGCRFAGSGIATAQGWGRAVPSAAEAGQAVGGGSAIAFQHRRRRRGSALQVCDLSFNFRRSGERIVRERLR